MSEKSLRELRTLSVPNLVAVASEVGIEQVPRRKQDILFAILKRSADQGTALFGDGVLEIMQDGYGFLRSDVDSYLAGPGDIYISPSQIRRYHLKTGDSIEGKIRPPKEGERYFAMLELLKLNGAKAQPNKRRVDFETLTPLFPHDRLRLERQDGSTHDITPRIIDLVAPMGKGQRALIVSQPKAGKTMMLQNIAESITANHPECKLIVLLIDERPEEVTEMQRSVKGEVVASTFDEATNRHIQVAEMVIAKAKRLVESGQDVVVLLDSITRLARAYNTATPSSGRVLSGGIDANALHRPKRFFGAARNIEEGGSLTIIGTALIDTGSKMDDVIYEEFKGTGNLEIHLQRSMAQRHILPAINVLTSGTRREDLITTEEELKRLWVLRKYLQTMEDSASTEFLIDRFKQHKTNAKFFDAMKSN